MSKKLQRRLNEIKQKISEQQLADAAYKYFVNITPKDTGNARRNTSLSGNEIRAKYPYATRLDNGWSRQAPKGMVKPTIQFLRDYIRKILGAR